MTKSETFESPAERLMSVLILSHNEKVHINVKTTRSTLQVKIISHNNFTLQKYTFFFYITQLMWLHTEVTRENTEHFINLQLK